MTRLGAISTAAACVAAGALLSLAVGALVLGVAGAGHLVVPLAIAATLTIAAVAPGARWLARASLRSRFVLISIFAICIGLANLAVLASTMVVDNRDAEIVAVLLIYSACAAIGAGLAVGRASAVAMDKIAEAARRMAGGDLEARVAHLAGGRELERMGVALDDMARDLSAAQRRERSIEAQRRDLVVAVSHDLRTPLADLQAMAEAIEDGVVSDRETVVEYAGRMSSSVGSIARLVDDLFEFVQLDAAAIEAERECARVHEVVDWAVAACDGQAALKGLHLHTELGDAGNAECSPRLTRVLQNLLQNAIRHTPSDGSVVVLARRDARAIELAVEDSGEGIVADPVDRVFEPFWRGDESRTETGSGLGLALAKRIVESLGGSIAVASSPPHGSRFEVRLPQSG